MLQSNAIAKEKYGSWGAAESIKPQADKSYKKHVSASTQDCILNALDCRASKLGDIAKKQ